MGRCITRDDYDALLHAYRKVPGNFSGASKATGCCRATCRRGWEIGWPRWGFKPIKDVLAEEAAEVRRRLEEVAERERRAQERERRLKPLVDSEKDRLDAMARREQWAQTCKGARSNAQLMLLNINEMLKTAFSRAGEVKRLLTEAEFTPLQWLRVTRELTATGRMVTEALHLTLQTEHLALGQPTEILGLMPMEVTLEEAQVEIRAAQEALERVRRKRALPAPAPQLAEAGGGLGGAQEASQQGGQGETPARGDGIACAPPPPSCGIPADTPPNLTTGVVHFERACREDETHASQRGVNLRDFVTQDAEDAPEEEASGTGN